jgi:surface protein
MFGGCYEFNQPLNHWNVRRVTNMKQLFKDCQAFQQVLPWELCVDVDTTDMFTGSCGALVERHSLDSIRRRNGEIAHSIVKRANHPNMMDFDSMEPAEADEPDFVLRLMTNVRMTTPELWRVRGTI